MHRKLITIWIALITVLILGSFDIASGALNEQINYQGKLTNESNVLVPDLSYNLRFRLCTGSTCAAVGDPIWTETRCYSPDNGTTCDGTGTDQRTATISGLFSVLLGSITSISSVNFNQSLYLEVQVGGSDTTPSWQTLTPRKLLGIAPGAFEAKKLGGYTWAVPGTIGSTTPNTGVFTTLTANSTSDALIISGAGANINFSGAGTAQILTAASQVLNLQSGGNLTIKTSGDTDDYITIATIGDIPTIYGTGSYLRIGDAGTTGHSLAADDDLMVSGKLEVDGQAYFDSNVDIRNGATSAGVLAIYEDSDDGTNNATFTVPALAADTDYILPTTDGDSSQFLQTNGSGVLTWATPFGSGDVTDVGDCAGGACLDGTIDGGTYISFYDAQGAGQLITGNLTAARTWTLPDATGTVALTANKLSVFAATTSAELAGVLSDESGTGVVAYTTSPVFTTPNIGSATGSVSGNAGTATALAADPTDCGANTFATTIAASGNLTCAAVTYSGITAMTSANLATIISDETGTGLLVFDTAPSFASTIRAGAAATYDGIIISPAVKGAGQFDLTLSTADLTAARAINFPDAGGTVALTANKLSVFAATTSAELAGVLSDESGTGVVAYTTSPVFTTPNIGSATGSVSGNAGTATALAADPTDCGANTFATTIAASGNLTCAAVTYSGITAMTSANLATIISDETGTGLLVFDTAPSFASTIRAGAAATYDGIIISPAVKGTGQFDLTLSTADLTAARAINFPDAGGTVALTANKLSVFAATTSAELAGVLSDESGTGVVAYTTSPVFTTPNIGSATGSVSGNAGTATALAADPTDCGANTFATTIAASGNLTCAAVTYSGITAMTSANLATIISDETGTGLLVFDTAPSFASTIRAGAAATYDGIIISPAVKGAGQFDLTLSTADLTAARAINFPDVSGTVVTTGDTGSVTGTMIANDTVALTTDTSGNYVASVGTATLTGLTGGAAGSEGATLSLAFDYTTALSGDPALAANNIIFGTNGLVFEGATANTFETFLTVTDPTADATITLPNATGTVALTANKLSVFAATTSAELAGVLSDESGTGVVAYTTSPVFTTPNIGSATGSVSGNAGTATALAADPTDCGANTFATTIAASGNLTCAAVTYSGITAMTSANLATIISDETGTGLLVFDTAPSFASTIRAGAAATYDGIIISPAVKGTGQFDLTLSTADLTAARAINFPDAGGTVALTANKLSVFAATTSAELAGVLSDESGTGVVAYTTSPVFTTPNIGSATGSVSGNAGTATALAADPTDCGANTFATTIAASGNLTCAAVTYSGITAMTSANLATIISDETGTGLLVFDTAPSFASTIRAGAAATYDGIIISPAVKGAGQFDLTLSTADLTAARAINFPNVSGTVVTTGDTGSVTGTMIANDTVALTTDTSGNYVASVGTATLTGLTGGAAGSEGATLSLAFDYTTALSGDPALAANNIIFGTNGLVFEGATANTFETFLTVTDPTADATITLPNATGTVALTANKLSVFAATTSAELAGVLSDESGTGVVAYTTSPVFTTPNIGSATGSVSGNAGTATALAADPTDCGANTFATTIAASGNLTCAAVTYSGITAMTSANLATIISDETGTGLLVFDTAPSFASTIRAGAAATYDGIIISPAVKGAGQFDLTLSTADLTAARAINFPNVSGTVVTTGDTGSVTGTMIANDTVALTTDTSGNYVASVGTATLTGLTGGAAGSEGATLSLAFDYTTALSGDPALAANNIIFGTNGLVFEGATANTFETFLTVTDPTADATITLPNATGTVALTANKLSVFAATTSAELAGVLSDESGTGVVAYTTSPVFTTPNIGSATGSVSGNAGTATALAADPTDCGANTFATTIAASGNLTCAAVTYSGITAMTSANLATIISDETGTGLLVFDTAPSFASTIRAGAAATYDGIIISPAVKGTGQFDLTLSTADLTAARAINFPDAGGTVALTANKLSVFAATTSAELAGVLSDESGTGVVAYTTSPVFTTPNIGSATGSVSGNAGTATALAADPTDCGANTFATTIAASGNLTCAAVTYSGITAMTSANLATIISDETGTGLLVFDTAPSFASTIRAGAAATYDGIIISPAVKGAGQFDLTLSTADLTAARAINFPNVSGTVVTTGDTGSVTGTMIANDTVALTTDTSGNYVASVGTATLTGLTGGAAGSEGATLSLAFDYTTALSGDPALAANNIIFGTNGLVFEGATANTFETFLTVTDPTADATITLPNATGTVALTANKLSVFAATTSAELAGVLSDESGTGVVAYTTSPVFTTPNIGSATGSVSGNAGTATALAADPTDCGANTFATTIAASGNLTCAAVTYSGITAMTSANLATIISDETGTGLLVFDTAPSFASTIRAGAAATYDGIIISPAVKGAGQFDLTLSTADLTAARAINFPNVSGTVVTTGDTGSVTGTMIANDTVALTTDTSGNYVASVGTATLTGLTGGAAGSEGATLSLAFDYTTALSGDPALAANNIIFGTNGLVFEGATANTFETFLTVTDPTADATITLPNATGTVALTANKLSVFAATTSAELAGVLSDESGTGVVAYTTSPVFTTPNIGSATGSVSGNAGTATALAADPTDCGANTFATTIAASGNLTCAAVTYSGITAMTSANLATIISDETGTGLLVFDTAPSFASTIRAGAAATYDGIIISPAVKGTGQFDLTLSTADLTAARAINFPDAGGTVALTANKLSVFAATTSAELAGVLSDESGTGVVAYTTSPVFTTPNIGSATGSVSGNAGTATALAADPTDCGANTFATTIAASGNLTCAAVTYSGITAMTSANLATIISDETGTGLLVFDTAPSFASTIRAGAAATYDGIIISPAVKGAGQFDLTLSTADLTAARAINFPDVSGTVVTTGDTGSVTGTMIANDTVALTTDTSGNYVASVGTATLTGLTGGAAGSEGATLSLAFDYTTALSGDPALAANNIIFGTNGLVFEGATANTFETFLTVTDPTADATITLPNATGTVALTANKLSVFAATTSAELAGVLSDESGTGVVAYTTSPVFTTPNIGSATGSVSGNAGTATALAADPTDCGANTFATTIAASGNLTCAAVTYSGITAMTSANLATIISDETGTGLLVFDTAPSFASTIRAGAAATYDGIIISPAVKGTGQFDLTLSTADLTAARAINFPDAGGTVALTANKLSVFAATTSAELAGVLSDESGTGVVAYTTSPVFTTPNIGSATGSVSGNAGTATALAADPTDCGANTFATTIAASGNLTCAAVTYSGITAMTSANLATIISDETGTGLLVFDTAPSFASTIRAGAAATYDGIIISPAVKGAGQFDLTLSTADLTAARAINFPNVSGTVVTTGDTGSVTGTMIANDTVALTTDTSGNYVASVGTATLTGLTGGAAGSEGATLSLAFDYTTALSGDPALAANNIIFGTNGLVFEGATANTFETFLTVTDPTADATITLPNATGTVALTANKLSVFAATTSAELAGVLSDESGTGVVAYTTSPVFTTPNIGSATGSVSGNAGTATALAADPTDCGANTFATTIAASGNLTCAAVTYSGITAMTSANLATIISDETGTGLLVFDTAPSFASTIRAGAAATYDGIIISPAVKGTGQFDLTLSTADLTAARAINFPDAGGTVALTANKLSVFAATTSAELAGVLSDESGTGVVAYTTSPVFTTPNIGSATGSVSGNAGTATALAADPTDCGANTFATTIAASGNLTCAAVTYSGITAMTSANLATIISDETGTGLLVFDTAPSFASTIRAGAAATYDGIIISPAVKGAGQFDLTLSTADLTAARAINFPNVSGTVVTTGDTGSVTGTMIANDTVALTTDTSGNYVASVGTATLTGLTGGAAGSEGATLSLAFDYTTALSGDPALAANNIIFGTNGLVFEGATANTFETFLTVTDPTADATITLPNATGTVALTANKLSVFAATTSAELAGVLSDESGTGVVAYTTSPVFTTPNIGSATGSVSGNAGTATALAADPTDCGANTFATTIAASGNLTCAAVTYSGITAMTSANLATIISDETGTGLLVFDTAPSFASTIRAGAAATYDGIIISPAVKGTGQFDLTLSTADLTAARAINFPDAGGTVALTANKLSVFAATTSAELAGVLSDESGTGVVAYTTSPVFTTPNIGSATGSVSGNAGTATALAADPTDCGANTFATTIAASGNLTCAAVTYSGITAMTSANLATIISDETGTGLLVFDTAPSFASTIRAGAAATYDGIIISPAVKGAGQFDLTLSTADLTAARAINFPNVSGTVVTTGDTGSVTGTMIANDTVALTTDTSGNYVASVGTATLTGLTGGAAGSEGATLSLAFDYTTALSGDPALAANNIIFGTNGLVFEGATANTFETFLTVTDPTADATITLPNATGTVALTANKLSVFAATTSAELAGVLSDESGTGVVAYTTSPVFTTPNIGSATGSVSGNAGTATALAADPTDCGANTFATTIAASGNLTCAAVTYSGITAMTSANLATIISDETGTGLLVFDTAPSFASTIRAGAAATYDGIIISPAVKGAGQFDLTLSTADLTAARAINFPNVSGTVVTTGDTGSVTGTMIANDTVALTTDTSGNYVASVGTATLTGLTGGAAGSEGATLSLAFDYTTALSGDPALAANNIIFGTNGLVFEGATANTFETFLTVTDPTADATITLPNATGTVALTANKLSVFAATTSAELAGVLSDESGTGVVAYTTSPVFTTPNIGSATGSVSGNAGTATALAADPTDCGANTFATTIAASGNLTCAAVTYSGITAMTSANLATIISDETGTGLLVFDTAPSFASTIRAGAAATYDGIIISPAVKGAGQFDLTLSTADLTAARAINFPNVSGTVVTTGDTGSVTGTMIANDTVALTTDTSGNYVASVGTATLTGLTGGAAGSEGATLSLAFDYTTALSGDPALAANNIIFGTNGLVFEGATANTFETFLTVTDPTADATITLPNATGTVALTANKLSVFAATTSAELAGVLSDESGTGVVAYTTSPVFTTPNIGSATGSVSGNAGTATALAADPTDCGANTFATTIAASGNLTCAAVTYSGITAMTSANLATIISDETGTGLLVFDTAPSFASTIRAGAAATYDGIIISPAVKGTGQFDLTLSTADLTAARAINFPDAGGTVALTANKLSVFAATTSAELAGVLSDESGTGVVAYTTSPVFTTPNIGSATGSVSGNAGTATALAADPTDCGANTFATTIAASGNLTCAAVTYSGITAMTSANLATIISDETGTGLLVFDTAPSFASTIRAGAAATYDGIIISPAVKGAGQFDLTLSTADLTAARAINFPNVSGTVVTTGDTGSVTGTMIANDTVALTTDTSGNYVASVGTATLTGLTGGAAGSEGATLSLAFDYTTALSGDPALAANNIIFGTNGLVFEGATANTFETFLTVTDPTADATITLPNATGTVALTANKLSVFAATTSAELAGVLSDESGTGALMFATSPTITTSLIISDGATIGQAAGPLMNFDDTNNYLEISGAKVGIGTAAPSTTVSAVGSVSSAGSAITTITNNNTTSSANTVTLRLNTGVAAATSATGRYVTFYSGVSSGDSGGTAQGNIGMGTNGVGVNYATSGADYAEEMQVSGETEPGDIIALTSTGHGKAVAEQSLVGVVSDSAGFTGNSREEKDSSKTYAVVGLLGHVKTKVSLESGPISVGDFITASSTPGVGMKAAKEGMVIGFALEKFDGNDPNEKILVFVNPHWSIGQSSQDTLVQNEENKTILSQFALVVKNSLEKLGFFIKDGVAKIKELVVNKITAQEMCLEQDGEKVCITKNQLSELLLKNQASLDSSESNNNTIETLLPVEQEESQESSSNVSSVDQQLPGGEQVQSSSELPQQTETISNEPIETTNAAQSPEPSI